MSKKYKIATLGCRTNQYESEAYQNQLQAKGYIEAKENEDADLCIVNTCTVTASADSHSRNQIRKLRKKYPNAKIAVTGCMVEKSKNQLLEIDDVDHVISNKEKETLLKQIYPEDEFIEFKIEELNSQTRAFVKIQDGCNSFCTYCIIPYVRGRSRSKTSNAIYSEVTTLVKNGVKEIVLTGINIGDYDGNDKKNPDNLAKLIQRLIPIVGLERIRVSSIDPDEVDEELLETILSSDKTCKSMHIVLQSGSNFILNRMNRKYTKQMFFESIDRLKAKCPEFTFTTDVIVGFPGEREVDFQDTLDVVKEVNFAKVHMFPYSRRERTKAYDYTDHVDPKIVNERKNRLLRFSEKAAFNLRETYVGKKARILTENNSVEDQLQTTGHTDNFLKVIIKNEKIEPNQIVDVILIENTPQALIGEVL